MKPIRFKDHSAILAEEQSECLPLDVYSYKNGEVISCWKFSFWEKLRVLIGKPLWLNVMILDEPMQPVILSMNFKDL